MTYLQSLSDTSKKTVCSSTSICSSTSFEFREKLSLREKEAKETLQKSQIVTDIVLVCSHFPFQDPGVRLEILSQRYSGMLDSILISLPCQRYHDEHWNQALWPTADDTEIKEIKEHKAKEILRRIDPDPPQLYIWNWQSPIVSSDMNASQIAKTFHWEMVEASSRVHPTAFVRAACGYSAKQVEELLDGVVDTRRKLHHLFHELHQPTKEYELAEKELRKRNPLAHWPLLNSLRGFDGYPSEALDYIFVPIQSLFERLDLSLIPLLQHLAVLTTLCQYQTDREPENIDYNSLFYADFTFLERIISKSPEEVARQMTEEDTNYFRLFCAGDFFVKESIRIRDMNSQWSRVADAVKICSTALPYLVEPISKVVQILFRFKNYYSGMALLEGLRNARHYPESLSSFWKLLSIDGYYAAYEELWLTDPGLPFLFPHLRKFLSTDDENKKCKILLKMFLFVSYPGWQHVDDICGHETQGGGVIEAQSKKPRTSSGLWCNASELFALSLVRLEQRWNGYDESCAHVRCHLFRV